MTIAWGQRALTVGSSIRETDVRLGTVPTAFDPFEAEGGGGGSSIATVAIVPVATAIAEPHTGHALLVSVTSDLQVMQRSMDSTLYYAVSSLMFRVPIDRQKAYTAIAKSTARVARP